MVGHHFRIQCMSSVLWFVNITFSTVCFLNVYITVFLSSNGSGDTTSRLLLLRNTIIIIPIVFWHLFLPSKFCGTDEAKQIRIFVEMNDIIFVEMNDTILKINPSPLIRLIFAELMANQSIVFSFFLKELAR
jgi:hypothetical protein